MNYYNEIKRELINNEITKRIKDYNKNRSDLNAYYKVGKMLSEAGKHYGEGIIKKYSKKLTEELGKGYSKRNLWLILRFYQIKEKMQTVSTQLSWSHYLLLLLFDNYEEIAYYIKIAKENKLTQRQLQDRIKSKEYERLDEKTKLKLINKEESNIRDFIKKSYTNQEYQ